MSVEGVNEERMSKRLLTMSLAVSPLPGCLLSWPHHEPLFLGLSAPLPTSASDPQSLHLSLWLIRMHSLSSDYVPSPSYIGSHLHSHNDLLG